MRPGLILQHGPSSSAGLLSDAGTRLGDEREHGELARTNPFQPFDGFWERAQRSERRDP